MLTLTKVVFPVPPSPTSDCCRMSERTIRGGVEEHRSNGQIGKIDGINASENDRFVRHDGEGLTENELECGDVRFRHDDRSRNS